MTLRQNGIRVPCAVKSFKTIATGLTGIQILGSYAKHSFKNDTEAALLKSISNKRGLPFICDRSV
ncbi:hypothetical protein [Tumidithrix helvetica]|uniref:hypothetical protein n=1 Tax=Tumidithrix helvetica TaxID=3457545 RepID=UPI003CC55104